MVTTTILAGQEVAPSALRQARRDVEMFDAHFHGATYKDLAKAYGYVNASGPQKRVTRLLEITGFGLDPFWWWFEWWRLEDLQVPLWHDLKCHGLGTRRRLRVVALLRDIVGVENRLTAGFKVVPDNAEPLGGFDADAVVDLARSPSGAQWTEALQARVGGLSLADLATRLGLADGSEAREQLESDLLYYQRHAVHRQRGQSVLQLNEMQVALWERAMSSSPDLDASRSILDVIVQRAELLGLFPDSPERIDMHDEAGFFLRTGPWTRSQIDEIRSRPDRS